MDRVRVKVRVTGRGRLGLVALPVQRGGVHGDSVLVMVGVRKLC